MCSGLCHAVGTSRGKSIKTFGASIMPSSRVNYFQSSTLSRGHQTRGRLARLLALSPWQLAGIVPHFRVNKPGLRIRLDSAEQSKRQPEPHYSVAPLWKIKLEAIGAPCRDLWTIVRCHLLLSITAALLRLSGCLFHLVPPTGNLSVVPSSPWRPSNLAGLFLQCI